MAGDAVDFHLLFLEQDVVSDLENAYGGIKLRPHEIGKRKLVEGIAHKQGPSFRQSGHGLAGEVIEGDQAAAVGISGKGVIVKPAEDIIHVDRDSQQLLVLLEQVDPGIEIARAVVAVDHGHGCAVGRSHDVDHLVGLGQVFLQHDHGKGRCAGRHVAGAGTHGVGGHHSGAGVSFRRAEGNARFQTTGRIQAAGAFLREYACRLSRRQHLRENIFQLPGIAFGGHQLVKLGDPRLVEVAGRGVNRHHARSVPHPQHLAAGKLPMDISGKGREEYDILYVRFPVQNALVQMREAPAERHIELKEFAQRFCCGTGVGVAPGTEWNQQPAGRVEGHVAVHHGADADSRKVRNFHIIPLAHVFPQVGIALLQSGPDSLQAVGPETVLKLVLPFMAALGDRHVLPVDQDSLDTGTAELDA